MHKQTQFHLNVRKANVTRIIIYDDVGNIHLYVKLFLAYYYVWIKFANRPDHELYSAQLMRNAHVHPSTATLSH